MVFKKGQILNLKYTKKRNLGGERGFIDVEINGSFEVIRTGKRLYLFCDEHGIDFNPTKKELIEIIQNENKNTTITPVNFTEPLQNNDEFLNN
jgi:hypothetical protein